MPIEEGEKKDDDDEEEGAEEVALDWWSKYFASKENQCPDTKHGTECEETKHSDDEGDENENAEGRPRFNTKINSFDNFTLKSTDPAE